MDTRTLEISKISEEIEYQCKGKVLIGTVFEIDIKINKFGTDIVYHLEDDLNKHIQVDGKTFEKI